MTSEILGMSQQQNVRKFGVSSWKYGESFLASFILVFIGFFTEFATGGKGISMPGWPANLMILLLFVAYVIIFHFLVKHPVKRWLSSVPAAISAISVFSFLVLLMGFIPQGENNGSSFISGLGLTHIAQSWPYLLSSLYLIFILSFTIIRRLLPFSLKNVAFTLNHLGLWIVVVAGSLGASDSMQLTMMLSKNKITIPAYNDRGQAFDLGFGIKLLNFSIDEYPPTLGLINTRSGELVYPKENLTEAVKGNKAKMGNWSVEVKEYIENAQKDDSARFMPSATPGAPTAYISANNLQNDVIAGGWVTSGSPFVYRQDLVLPNDQSIAMTTRKPKKYISEIRAYYDMNKYEDFTVEVNKPVKFKGWTIYQSGYDEQMGKWSTTSIIQLVRDPWLPAVYTGIFMILAGALFMFWTGRAKNQQ